MKQLLFILLVFIQTAVFAQADTASLSKAVSSLHNALLQKDTVALKELLNDKVAFGHSNGWIQTKHDVIEDFFNGKLSYTKADMAKLMLYINGATGIARYNTTVTGLLNDRPFTLTLQVMQAWVYEKKHWRLLSRQSIKVNE